ARPPPNPHPAPPRHFTDLPAGLAPPRESVEDEVDVFARHAEEEPSRRLGLEEQAGLGARDAWRQRQPAARFQGALEVHPIALHASTPLPLLGELERPGEAGAV